MRGVRREVCAVVGALAFHAAVLGYLRWWVGDSVSRARPVVTTDPVAWDIELATGLEADVPREGRRGDATSSGHAVARFVPHSSAGNTTLDEAEAEPEGFEIVEPDSEGEAAEAAPPSTKPIDLGIGADGWQRWLEPPKAGEARLSRREPRGPIRPIRAPRPSKTFGIQEGLEERDRALGLGPSGPVISALRRAAHATVAPEIGVAHFDVTVHRTGTVEVTLRAASDHVERWRKLAGIVAKELRKAPPRIPPKRRGMRLLVELVAEETLPNGTDATSLRKPHLDTPLEFKDTEAGVEQLNHDNPTENPTPDDLAVKLDAPGAYVAGSGKVCSYRFGLGSIAPGYQLGAAVGPSGLGACDPTHVGAKPQRMVRARVVEQSMF